jgi:hypothetical protein
VAYLRPPLFNYALGGPPEQVQLHEQAELQSQEQVIVTCFPPLQISQTLVLNWALL